MEVGAPQAIGSVSHRTSVLVNPGLKTLPSPLLFKPQHLLGALGGPSSGPGSPSLSPNTLGACAVPARCGHALCGSLHFGTHNCNVPFSARRERLGFRQRPVPSCCVPSLGSSSRAGAALQECREDKDRVSLVPVSRAPDTAAAEGTSAGPEVRSRGCLRGFGAAGDLSDQQLQDPPCRCPLLGSSPQEWLPAASRHPRASSSCFQILREGPEQRPGRNGPSLLSLCSSGCQPWPPAWPLPPSAARGSCSLPAPVTGLQPTSQECLLLPLGGWFPPLFEGQLCTPHSPTPSPTCGSAPNVRACPAGPPAGGCRPLPGPPPGASGPRGDSALASSALPVRKGSFLTGDWRCRTSGRSCTQGTRRRSEGFLGRHLTKPCTWFWRILDRSLSLLKTN
ncbi:homeobox protein unc-4 homolog [Eubalaena glacialis]|uniref:homeobox protein unc-4 homolog n=1 Tax=Eubalaena glacialis TaxID=27606 RepID=UPI002A599231|nr:homeobox protein unc-4 homolog [Eubalaena glacialis]